jgi:hypothetical protein
VLRQFQLSVCSGISLRSSRSLFAVLIVTAVAAAAGAHSSPPNPNCVLPKQQVTG